MVLLMLRYTRTIPNACVQNSFEFYEKRGLSQRVLENLTNTIRKRESIRALGAIRRSTGQITSSNLVADGPPILTASLAL